MVIFKVKLQPRLKPQKFSGAHTNGIEHLADLPDCRGGVITDTGAKQSLGFGAWGAARSPTNPLDHCRWCARLYDLDCAVTAGHWCTIASISKCVESAQVGRWCLPLLAGGIQLWLAPALVLDVDTATKDATSGTLFRQGLFAAVSNPKVLLFYGAFLPQFINPNRSLGMQFVMLAATFVTVECAVELLLANLAHRIRPVLNRVGKKFNRVCGILFALMGSALPMTN